MREYTIAVCDDEEYFGTALIHYIETYKNEREISILCDYYDSGNELLEQVSKGKRYDMVFMDVDMPEKNGVETAWELRKIAESVMLCFATSYRDYAMKAYEVRAEGYLLKPVQYKELKMVLDKVIVLLDYKKDREEAKKRYLEIEAGCGHRNIEIQQILYIEKRRNQCVFHMEEGEVICYQTLANVYKELNQSQFLYTHQGYIVNIEKVKEVARDCVYLGNGIEVPISRGKIKEVKHTFEEKVLGFHIDNGL